MIDIHTHLLPGVDDGSPSIDASVEVLRRWERDGVECVVLTPHLTASRAAAAPIERHRAILDQLRVAAPSTVELRLGWEIMLDRPGVDLRSEHLSLGHSSAVLVEFPHMSVPSGATHELFRIRGSGCVPVLAHPERYWGCTVARVQEWRSAGAVIQMDIAGLMGRGTIGTLSRALLEAGLVDVLASDNHADTRSLATARDWLLEVGTPEHAELLTNANARCLLEGEPVRAVPPLAAPRGIFERLRDMFTRR